MGTQWERTFFASSGSSIHLDSVSVSYPCSASAASHCFLASRRADFHSSFSCTVADEIRDASVVNLPLVSVDHALTFTDLPTPQINLFRQPFLPTDLAREIEVVPLGPDDVQCVGWGEARAAFREGPDECREGVRGVRGEMTTVATSYEVNERSSEKMRKGR